MMMVSGDEALNQALSQTLGQGGGGIRGSMAVHRFDKKQQNKLSHNLLSAQAAKAEQAELIHLHLCLAQS